MLFGAELCMTVSLPPRTEVHFVAEPAGIRERHASAFNAFFEHNSGDDLVTLLDFGFDTFEVHTLDNTTGKVFCK